MAVINTGTTAATNTVDLDGRTDGIMFQSTAGATVTLNGKSVKIPAAAQYTYIPGSYDIFTVTAGTVEWIAYG